MLRRQQQIRIQLQKLVDAGLFSLALCAAHWVRDRSGIEVFGGTAVIEPLGQFLWLLLFIFPVTPLVLELQGFYRRPLIPSRRLTFWQLLKGCILMTLGAVLLMFLMKEQLARSVIILFGFTAFIFVAAKEEILRRWMRTAHWRDQLKRRLILVGTSQDTEELERKLKVWSNESLEILARLDLNETAVELLSDMLHDHSANGVLINASHTYFGKVEQAIQACELEGVEVWLLADFFKTQISRTTLDDFLGRPMLVFRSTPDASWQAVAKQALDFVGALWMLAVLSPVMVLVALAIRITSPGPVLFRQTRCGLNGRPFTMLKFRSMVTDAEQRRREMEDLNEMTGPVFKVSNDPRITPVGRFIRKYSLDELPQLINVVRGEMSLVGPRPLPVDEVRRFDDLAHRRRLSVKPGLTCLWQISGRSNLVDFREWVRLDLEYIDNWSIWLDLKILLRTVPAVFSGAGAK